jgi:hypothetical protein
MAIAVPEIACLIPAPTASADAYRPRRPQDTLLHRVVREHFPTFLAHTGRIYARPLPRYVAQEFEKYLVCGDLTRGFVRCVCASCGLEQAVPFSCKTRGLCPSCAGRRMADSAARLVDSVLPDVPLRQWVLTLPFDLRLLAAMRADVLRYVVRAYVETIHRWMRRRLPRPGAAAGSVAATHRGGGALNLSPHLHVLTADGLFVRRPAGGVGFRRVPAPAPTDLRWVVETVRRRVLRRLARMGLLRDDRLAGEGSNEGPDPSALEACGTLALRAGALESHDGPAATPDDVPSGGRSSRWSAHDGSFNIHAGVRVPAGDHVGRERLCRYVTRPPFAMDRFTELPDGRIAYRVRHPLGPGKTHRVMTPVELLARLAALVPPPRFPLLRYFGVFAANSPWRSAVVPRPPDTAPACRHGAAAAASTDRKAPPFGGSAEPHAASRPADAGAAGEPLLATPTSVPRTLSPEHWRRLDDGRLLARQPRVDWATLLRRTWAEDVLICPRCAGRMAVLEPVTEPADIREHLERLGLPAVPAAFAPPRDPDDLAVSRASRTTGPGPPSAGRSPDDGRPLSSDDFADPPWQEDCQLPLYDDASQVPPDAQG